MTAAVTILSVLIVLVPLQFLPVSAAETPFSVCWHIRFFAADKKNLSWTQGLEAPPCHTVVAPGASTGIESRTIRWLGMLRHGVVGAFVMALLSSSLWVAIPMGLVAMLLSVAGLRVRRFVAARVISSLVLPARSVGRQEILLSDGTRMRASQAAERLRETMFAPLDVEQGSIMQWQGTRLTGAAGQRIDVAVLENAAQSSLAPAERCWLVWFLGNGELYEFCMGDVQKLAALAGLNALMFNYRGVCQSEGVLSCAQDLVEDGILCVDHLKSSFGAAEKNILLFGHSIGGAVAAHVKLQHAPLAAVVIERSFRDFSCAAYSVYLHISRGLLGSPLRIPQLIIYGLLSSVFKGRLDCAAAWLELTGSRLCIYHEDDEVLTFAEASLFQVLHARGLIRDDEGLRLTQPHGRIVSNHNAPLHLFPEYPQIARECRKLLGLVSFFLFCFKSEA